MPDLNQSTRLLLTGRVQGVGFRYFVFRAAMETGIKGWVRNLPDGRVEIRAEGNGEALLDFRRKIEIGPPSGLVREVASEEGEVEHFAEFKIIG